MAYQLQPGLSLVENPALPKSSATDDVFVYPQPSSISMGARPNTMLYGTAPAKFGKGAPAQYVETSDRLRPQSTSTHQQTTDQDMGARYLPGSRQGCRFAAPIRGIQRPGEYSC